MTARVDIRLLQPDVLRAGDDLRLWVGDAHTLRISLAGVSSTWLSQSDLAGAEATLRVYDESGQEVVAEAAVVDASARMVTVAFDGSELPDPGVYRALVDLDLASGEQVTVPTRRAQCIRVRDIVSEGDPVQTKREIRIGRVTIAAESSLSALAQSSVGAAEIVSITSLSVSGYSYARGVAVSSVDTAVIASAVELVRAQALLAAEAALAAQARAVVTGAAVVAAESEMAAGAGAYARGAALLATEGALAATAYDAAADDGQAVIATESSLQAEAMSVARGAAVVGTEASVAASARDASEDDAQAALVTESDLSAQAVAPTAASAALDTEAALEAQAQSRASAAAVVPAESAMVASAQDAASGQAQATIAAESAMGAQAKAYARGAALSATESAVDAVAADLAAWIADANVVCEGDSLTTAFGDATISWVDALNQYAPFGATGASATGVASSGDTITEMANNPPDDQIVPGEKNVLVFMGGTNDIREGGDGDTPAEAKAELDAYVTARKAAGWDRVVVLSPTPADESSQWITADDADEIDQYIQLIRDNPPADADAVGHATDAPELTDPLDTTYFLDGLHYTDAGHTVLAEDIVWPLLAVLTPHSEASAVVATEAAMVASAVDAGATEGQAVIAAETAMTASAEDANATAVPTPTFELDFEDPDPFDDKSGNGNHPTNNGVTVTTHGNLAGQVGVFVKSEGDYLDTPVVISGAYTKFVVLRVSSRGWTTQENILSSPSFDDVFWKDGGKFNAHQGGGFNNTPVDSTVNPENWSEGEVHSVAFTYDPNTTTGRLYIDGVFDAENTSMDPPTGNNAVQVGAYDSDFLFNQDMSYVAMWGDEALSDAQIAQLHNDHIGGEGEEDDSASATIATEAALVASAQAYASASAVVATEAAVSATAQDATAGEGEAVVATEAAMSASAQARSEASAVVATESALDASAEDASASMATPAMELDFEGPNPFDDKSGNGNHPTNNGVTAETNAAVTGQVGRFVASESRSLSTPISLGGSYTSFVVIVLRQAFDGTRGIYEAPNGGPLLMQHFASMKAYNQSYNDTVEATTYTPDWTAGEVHSVAVTYDAATQAMRIYIDGEFEAENTQAAPTGADTVDVGELGGADYWDDDMSYIALWDGDVLSDADITQLHNDHIGGE